MLRTRENLSSIMVCVYFDPFSTQKKHSFINDYCQQNLLADSFERPFLAHISHKYSKLKLFSNHGKVAKMRKELLKHYFWLCSVILFELANVMACCEDILVKWWEDNFIIQLYVIFDLPHTFFIRKRALKPPPENLKKMSRKSQVSNAKAGIFKNTDFPWRSLKVTKFSKC